MIGFLVIISFYSSTTYLELFIKFCIFDVVIYDVRDSEVSHICSGFDSCYEHD